MNVVLVAEGAAGVHILKWLAGSGHRVVALMTSSGTSLSRVATVASVARALGYQIWPANLVKQAAFADKLRTHGVDVLLNVHSLYIIHAAVLAAPRIGCFNMHPGPLPRYAGLNSVSWAIYHGETTHGVTVHRIAPEVDTGAIVYQTLFDIEGADVALSVSYRCSKEGIRLLTKLIETASISPYSIPYHPQDISRREYFGREIPEGSLCWSRPACEIVNFVRACDFYPFPSPWGYPRANLASEEFSVVKASRTGESCRDAIPGQVRQSGKSMLVATGDEWIALHKLIFAGTYADAAQKLRGGELLKDNIGVAATAPQP
jgi:methionyl-tRNA formyltransferase